MLRDITEPMLLERWQHLVHVGCMTPPSTGESLARPRITLALRGFSSVFIVRLFRKAR
jgi:hypothetical protein